LGDEVGHQSAILGSRFAENGRVGLVDEDTCREGTPNWLGVVELLGRFRHRVPILSHDLAVTDEDVPGTPRDEGDDDWGVDAALGAATRAARAANDVASVVGGSLPARLAAAAAKRLTEPLAKEGHEVRERLVTDAGPVARDAIQRVTPGVIDAVNINEVLAAIDMDALLDRIDIDRLVGRVDVGGIVSKVDVNELVQGVDVDGIVSRVDVGAVVERVDVDALISKVNLDTLLDRIDIGLLLDRIDLNLLLTKIDLNELLKNVDLNALLENVDLDALLDSVDMNSLVNKLDIDSLVRNTEIGSLIAQSTSGIAGEALDVVRSQGVGLDNFLSRWANRVLRRDPIALPAGPPLLIELAPLALPSGQSDSEKAQS